MIFQQTEGRTMLQFSGKFDTHFAEYFEVFQAFDIGTGTWHWWEVFHDAYTINLNVMEWGLTFSE